MLAESIFVNHFYRYFISILQQQCFPFVLFYPDITDNIRRIYSDEIAYFVMQIVCRGITLNVLIRMIEVFSCMVYYAMLKDWCTFIWRLYIKIEIEVKCKFIMVNVIAQSVNTKYYICFWKCKVDHISNLQIPPYIMHPVATYWMPASSIFSKSSVIWWLLYDIYVYIEIVPSCVLCFDLTA